MKRAGIAAACVMALASTLAACAGEGPSGGQAGSTTEKLVEEAKANTEAALAGTDRPLPKGGPRAQSGKTVWAIACTTQGAGCLLPAEGFLEAAKKLGWTGKLIDGKADPGVYNSQLRAAGAASVDAVALFGVDCSAVKGSIEAIQRDGVKVIGSNALDCDDDYSRGGKPLFDAYLPWGEDLISYNDYLSTVVGPTIADWVIAKTAGKAEIIQMRQDDSATLRLIGESQEKRLGECGGCTVHKVSYTGADLLGGKLQAKASAALQKYPNASVVMVPTDAAITLGVGAAAGQARAAGRKDLLLVGNEGVPSSIKLLRDGTQSYAIGRPLTWTGWATADALNRLFAGEKPVDPGIGVGSMDAGHLPTTDVYDGNPKSSGYQANYASSWGVG
ncbi:substrate-binding domain-containing protein [Micromonospora sp. B11E3]|uniref:sugar ABC transporter substrate-binding protein n=1 Tax=Micromonospora sp. B11E3 TaxID=3153562 RepID=UPI00325CCD5D